MPLKQTLERRVERTIIHNEFVFRLLLEELRDAVGVVWSALQAAKNQDFERALQEFQCFAWIVYRRHPTYLRLGGNVVKRAEGLGEHGDRPRHARPQSRSPLRARHRAPPSGSETADRADQVPVDGVPGQKDAGCCYQGKFYPGDGAHVGALPDADSGDERKDAEENG